MLFLFVVVVVVDGGDCVAVFVVVAYIEQMCVLTLYLLDVAFVSMFSNIGLAQDFHFLHVYTFRRKENWYLV